MLDILTAIGHTVSTLKAKVYSFSRPSGGTPALSKEKRVICSGTEHFVLVVAVTRQHVVPCKCISPAEGLFRFDEKETVETMLKFWKNFPEGLEANAKKTNSKHLSRRTLPACFYRYRILSWVGFDTSYATRKLDRSGRKGGDVRPVHSRDARTVRMHVTSWRGLGRCGAPVLWW